MPTATSEPAYEVGLVLMKSPEADATVEALLTAGQPVQVVDRGPYLHVISNEDIHVDLEQVADELGEDIALNQWLVVMSTYNGRIRTDAGSITITKDLPE
ncbi:MAG TPA: MmoB/DmpM family protein [Sporichthyaceae bacterium]|jgi:hypothetical protein|nr:MmoB/DmpM family protein [Sporichthyaceae bacterium]